MLYVATQIVSDVIKTLYWNLLSIFAQVLS